MATVLLADDDEELLEMYELWLSGFEELSVRSATDGEGALDLLDDDVDVAVLDRRMPEMSGDEAARSIHSSPVDCTVIIASAFEPDDNIDEEAYSRYLTKPLSRDDLVEAIDRAVAEPIAAQL